MADDPTRFQAKLAAAEAELHAWRRAHPGASLTEIEQALDARLQAARADLLAALAAEAPADAACCPACGGRLVRRGTRPRTLRTQGDTPLTLRRPYLSCPACAAGVFPPR